MSQVVSTEPVSVPESRGPRVSFVPAGAGPGSLAGARSAVNAERVASATRLLDAGWLFLIAGLALLGAAVLIPAQKDVEAARLLRDRALALEAHRAERITRHEEFLTAIHEQQPALVLSLAAGQLNQIPADRSPIGVTPEQVRATASVFPALEPPPARVPEARTEQSILEKWTGSERGRLWVVAAGSMLVLIGLLPPTISRR